MDDLINRQAAIDALDVLCQEHRYKIPGKRETYSQYNEAWQDALDRAEGAIVNLPSADIDLSGFSDKLWHTAYERGKAEAVRWIPVSEQLPEDEQEVLFSTKTGRVHLGRYYNDNSANQWYSSLDKMRAWNNVVNAWMPLPEPYKDGEQDG